MTSIRFRGRDFCSYATAYLASVSVPFLLYFYTDSRSIPLRNARKRRRSVSARSPSGHTVCRSARNLFANGDEIFDTRFALKTNNRLTKTPDTVAQCIRSKHVFRGASDSGVRPAKRETGRCPGSHQCRQISPPVHDSGAAIGPDGLKSVSDDYIVTSVPGRTKIEKPVCENNRTSLTSPICTIGNVNPDSRGETKEFWKCIQQPYPTTSTRFVVYKFYTIIFLKLIPWVQSNSSMQLFHYYYTYYWCIPLPIWT